jgi:hypothetical protein
LNFFLFNSLPVPNPGASDPVLVERVQEIAGQLASVDDRFAAWASEVGVSVGSVTGDDDRGRLEAELNAVVSLLYGLAEEDVRLIYETFREGWDYHEALTSVLEYYGRY